MGCGFASVQVGGTRLFQAQHFFCCCRRRRAFCHINATTKCDWSSSYGPCYVCHTWGDSFFSFGLLCFAYFVLLGEQGIVCSLSERVFDRGWVMTILPYCKNSWKMEITRWMIFAWWLCLGYFFSSCVGVLLLLLPFLLPRWEEERVQDGCHCSSKHWIEFWVCQDTMTRFWRMRGRPTLWLPGTDHAGIATQVHLPSLLHTSWSASKM